MSGAQWVGTVGVLVMLLPLAVCWGVWLLLAVLAFLPGKARPRGPRVKGSGGGGGMIDVLIPAHDEEGMLPLLLATLDSQTSEGKASLGRVLVVADHCSDGTAALARREGVEVLERNSGPRGKPAALRDGLAWLEGARGAVEEGGVMIIDADCAVWPDLLERVARAMDGGAKVVQASYVLEATKGKMAGPAVVAFALKNRVRPRGMAAIGLPTQLFGTGMCFSLGLLKGITFADHLTEDLKISHDLLLAGVRPVFVDTEVGLMPALVRSPLPAEEKGMTTQKMRWETGQVQTWAKLPGMMVRLALRGRVRAMVALVDWSAPPLAMAAAWWCVAAAAAVGLWAMHLAAWWVMIVAGAVMLMLMVYVLLGTMLVAGPGGVWRLMIGVPRFVWWKAAVYVRMVSGRGGADMGSYRAGAGRRGGRGEAMSAAAAMDVAMPERVELMGMPLDMVTEAEAVALLVRRQEAGAGTWVITPNLDILRRFVREKSAAGAGGGEVRELFGEADLFLGDGMPLVWASRMAKLGRSRRGLPERVPGSGLVFSVAAEAAKRGWRLYLLGGNAGAAEAAGRVLTKKYPGLVIAGMDCPEVGFEKDAAAMRAVEERVAAARADVVYVALGFPKQERVIRELRKVLPGAMFLGVGISLSFISGEVKRAPRWMQRVGLEWVHRMVQEPGRLVKRYLWEDLPFAVFRLMPHALRRRCGGRGRREGV